MHTHTNEPVSLVLLHLHTEGKKKDLQVREHQQPWVNKVKLFAVTLS